MSPMIEQGAVAQLQCDINETLLSLPVDRGRAD